MKRLRAVLSLLIPPAFAIAFTPSRFCADVNCQGKCTTRPQRNPAPAEPDYLGAELRELDADAVKTLDLTQDNAVLIASPAAGGPAERMGLMPGDVIVMLNGTLVSFVLGLRANGRQIDRQAVDYQRTPHSLSS